MATQNITQFSGKAGNIVFVNRYGSTFIRSLPVRVKRTIRSKKSSRNFGIAARAGKRVRELLHPSITFPVDRYMPGRFSGAIGKWLGSTTLKEQPPLDPIPYVTGFNFNPLTSLEERWKVKLSLHKMADNTLQLNIPAFIPASTLAAPANTVHIECIITTAVCKLADATPLGTETSSMIFPYNNMAIPAKTIDMHLSTQKGNLLITAVLLKFYIKKKGMIVQTSNAKFIPATVISAMYF